MEDRIIVRNMATTIGVIVLVAVGLIAVSMVIGA